MTPNRVLILCAPAFLGASWGLGQPLSKIAVEAGWQPWGIVTWQAVVSIVLAVVLSLKTGPVAWSKAAFLRWASVAIVATLIPHWASYTAVQDMPAGVMALVLASIPIFALVFGLVVGTERPELRRAFGIALGIAGVAIIVASRGEVAGSGLSGGVPLAALGIALIAPVCYALNSTFLDSQGRAGLHPLHMLGGASVLVFPIALSLALATNQFRVPTLAGPDLAMLAVAALHALSFAGLLWVIAKAGAVYAGITGSFVTAFGVIWSMILLSERYPLAIWVAFGLILFGLSLVRPRNTDEAPA